MFKSNHFSILPALPFFLFLFMLNWQLLLHPQRGWQVEQQLSSCRLLAACSLLLVAVNYSLLWCSSLWRTREVNSTKPSLFHHNFTKGAKEAKKVRTSCIIISKTLICMTPSWITQIGQRQLLPPNGLTWKEASGFTLNCDYFLALATQ